MSDVFYVEPRRLGAGAPDANKVLFGDRAWRSLAAGGGATSGHEAYTLQDEFVGGDIGTGAIGELGWTLSGNGSYSVQSSSSQSPGLGRLTSGATSGNNEKINLGPWLLPQVDQMEFIFIPVSNGSTGSARNGVGLGSGLAGTTPSDGVEVSYDTANSSTFLTVAKHISSVPTKTTSTIPFVAGALYIASLIVTAAGEVTVTVTKPGTGETQTVVLTGISETAQLNAFFWARTLTTVNKTLDVDYFAGSFSGLTRV